MSASIKPDAPTKPKKTARERLPAVEARLTKKFGRPPQRCELADALGVSPDRLSKIKAKPLVAKVPRDPEQPAPKHTTALGDAARSLAAANLRAAMVVDGRKPHELAAAAWPKTPRSSREQRLRRARNGENFTLDTAAELVAALGIHLHALFTPLA